MILPDPAEQFPQSYYKLTLSFNGTEFRGWQRQVTGDRTVQQTVEEILRRLFHDEALSLTGSSRTDAGVHALGMTASFHTASKIPPEQLTAFLEKQLPKDIRIRKAESVPAGFNAQTGNFGKAYIYAVKLGDYPLFLNKAVWTWPEAPCLERIPQVLPYLVGTHDFANFTGRAAGSTVRTIYRAELYRFSDVLCFYFSGDGFLHKMIRRIMGLLFEVAEGTLSPEDFRRRIEEPGRGTIEQVAPPFGLYLKKVFYESDEWRTDLLKESPFLS